MNANITEYIGEEYILDDKNIINNKMIKIFPGKITFLNIAHIADKKAHNPIMPEDTNIYERLLIYSDETSYMAVTGYTDTKLS